MERVSQASPSARLYPRRQMPAQSNLQEYLRVALASPFHLRANTRPCRCSETGYMIESMVAAVAETFATLSQASSRAAKRLGAPSASPTRQQRRGFCRRTANPAAEYQLDRRRYWVHWRKSLSRNISCARSARLAEPIYERLILKLSASIGYAPNRRPRPALSDRASARHARVLGSHPAISRTKERHHV